jgi:hypothetical protein
MKAYLLSLISLFYFQTFSFNYNMITISNGKWVFNNVISLIKRHQNSDLFFAFRTDIILARSRVRFLVSERKPSVMRGDQIQVEAIPDLVVVLWNSSML